MDLWEKATLFELQTAKIKTVQLHRLAKVFGFVHALPGECEMQGSKNVESDRAEQTARLLGVCCSRTV